MKEFLENFKDKRGRIDPRMVEAFEGEYEHREVYIYEQDIPTSNSGEGWELAFTRGDIALFRRKRTPRLKRRT